MTAAEILVTAHGRHGVVEVLRDTADTVADLGGRGRMPHQPLHVMRRPA